MKTIFPFSYHPLMLLDAIQAIMNELGLEVYEKRDVIWQIISVLCSFRYGLRQWKGRSD